MMAESSRWRERQSPSLTAPPVPRYGSGSRSPCCWCPSDGCSRALGLLALVSLTLIKYSLELFIERRLVQFFGKVAEGSGVS